MIDLVTDLTLVFEYLSFLASLIFCFRKNPPRYLKFFPAFLFITVVVESIGFVLRAKNITRNPIFNYFTLFEFLFYFFVLYHAIESNRVKKIIFYSGVLYFIVAETYNLTHDLKSFHSPIYSLGAILLVSFCVCYLYGFANNIVPQKPKYQPAFWVCLGLLFFYGGTLPFWAAYSFLRMTIFELRMFALYVGIANYFLYTSFAIAFIIFNKRRKQHFPRHFRS